MMINKRDFNLGDVIIICCIILVAIGKISVFETIGVYYIIECIKLTIHTYNISKSEDKVFVFKSGIKILMCLFMVIVIYTKFI